MRAIIRTSLFLILTLGAASVWAQGTNYKIGTTIRINERDTLASNVIAGGQFVDISGHLNDDLFGAARNIIIRGSVADDAIVAAQSVMVSGTVGDMLVATGETVIIDGIIDGDLFAAGNEVRLGANAQIGGNVALAGNEIIIEQAAIEGWMRVAGNEISVNGTVNNYVELYGSSFEFGPNYNPGSVTTITTSGELNRQDLPNAPEELNIIVEEADQAWLPALLFSIWFYIAMLIIGILLMLLFRETTADLYRFATERYLRNTGIGLVVFLAIPIAVVILMILVLTIPLSIFIMILYGLALFVGFLLVAVILGTRAIRYVKSEETFSDYIWGLALGMILIGLLSALPYAGPFINLALIFLGLGTLLSYFWQLRFNSI